MTDVLKRKISPTKTLLSVATSHMINHLNQRSMTLLYPLIMADLGLNYAQVGLVAASSTLTAGLLQFAFGVLSYSVPKRTLLSIGNLILGAGTALTGLASNFHQLILCRLVSGVGAAPQHPVGTSLIADQYARERRGRALSVHSGLALFGDMSGPLIALSLALVLGWRGSLFLLSLPTIVIALTIYLLVKENPVRRSQTAHSQWVKAVAESARNRNFLLITCSQAMLVGGRGLGIVLTFVPLYLVRELKVEILDTGVLILVLMVGGVVGTFSLGWLSDRVGRRSVLLPVMMFSALFTYSLTLFSRVAPALIPMLLLLGATMFSIPTLLQAYLSDLTDPSVRDAAYGTFFTVGQGTAVVWATVIGSLIDHFGFSSALTAMALITTVSTLPLLLVRKGSYYSD